MPLEIAPGNGESRVTIIAACFSYRAGMRKLNACWFYPIVRSFQEPNHLSGDM